MISWLFYKAQSATPFVAFVGGICFLTILGLPSVKRSQNTVNFSLLLVIVAALILVLLFDIWGIVLNALNREATLTGRTELWKKLLDIRTDPLFGVGYESFWLGSRTKELWREFWWRPNEAHNGYLEVYLNLGVMGVLLSRWDYCYWL